MSRAKLIIVGSLTIGSMLIACSDSTGPSAVGLAQHFDTLYSAAATHESIGYSIRVQVITDLEILAAFGATPRDVSVSTSSGVEHWKGFEFAINPNGDPFGSNNVLALYRDSNAHTVLVTSFAQNGAITSAALLVNDTLRVISSDFSGNSAFSPTNDACPDPPQLANPGLVPYVLSECTSAEFTASASAEFAIGSDVDAALSHLAFGSTGLDGEAFVSGFGFTGSHVVH